MCMTMHLLEGRAMGTTDRDGPDGDCDLVCLHPAQVAAARGRLTAAPPVAETAALLGVLADPTRLRLLTALGAGELCVCDLAVATGTNRTTVSHQLRVLRDHRLVRRRRAGRVAYYALDDDHVAGLLALAAAHVTEGIGQGIGPARFGAAGRRSSA
jgi:ArsR family transcriptional regulator, lead/cadmium/zinc/bismuth-responsive transcriptional repressor